MQSIRADAGEPIDIYQIIGYPLLPAAAVEIVLGIILIGRNRRRSPLLYTAAVVAFAMASWSLCAGIVYIRAGLGLDFAFYYRACWIGGVAFPAALHLVFLMKDERSWTAIWWGRFYPPMMIAIAALSLGTDLIDIEPVSLAPFVDRGGVLEMPMRIIGILFLVLSLAYTVVVNRTLTGLRKAQLQYLALGCAIFFLFGGSTTMVLYVFGAPIDPGLGCYFGLPWVFLTFYSTTRYRLLNLRTLIVRTTATVVIIAGAIVWHFGSVYLLESVLGETGAVLFSVSTLCMVFLWLQLSGFVSERLPAMLDKSSTGSPEVLRAAARSLASILDVETMLKQVLQLAQTNIGIKNIYVFLKDDQDGFKMEYHIGSGAPPSVALLSSDEHLIDWLRKTQRTFIQEEQRQFNADPEFTRLFASVMGLEPQIVTPIIFKDDLLGAIMLDDKADHSIFNQGEIDLIEALAAQAAIALENSRLDKKAAVDGLTDLYNQLYFKERLAEELSSTAPLSLIMIDIDDFKQVNDTYGHVEGDRVLVLLADILRGSIREKDVAARYGGEEFALLLVGCGYEAAHKTAERIRRTVEQTACGDIQFTISVGVTALSGEETGVTVTDLIERADRFLYQSKRAGKNRTSGAVFARDGEGEPQQPSSGPPTQPLS